MTTEEIIANVESICRKLQVEHLYLFGSYAKGTQTMTSDVDFAVKGCTDINAVRNHTELIPTLKKIDIVDYDRCNNRWLKEDIDRYGRQIY